MSKTPEQETLDEYVKRVVEALGPPTPEQINRVHAIWHGAKGRPARSVYVPDLREQERLAEAQRKADQVRKIRAYAASLMECEGCGAPPEAHVSSAGLHEWQPRKDVLAVVAGQGVEVAE